MTDKNPSSETDVRRLFAHRSISYQVDKIYNDANAPGRSKSLNSFAKIQKFLITPPKPKPNLKVPSTTNQSKETESRTTTNLSRKSTHDWQYGPHTHTTLPFGMEEFIETDHLFVSKATDSMEMPVNAANSIKYEVLNSNGDRIYLAHEIPKSLNVCSALFGYPYTFVLLNAKEQEVLRYEGDPAKCGSAASVQIQNKNERFGEVKRLKADPHVNEKEVFTVGDGNGNPVFVIKEIRANGTDFEVFSTNGEIIIGRITTKWGKYLVGKLASTDIFGISFTRALDVRMKALLLGALIMLDFHFFDRK